MKFLLKLISRKRAPDEVQEQSTPPKPDAVENPATDEQPAVLDDVMAALIERGEEAQADREASAEASVNIWDMDGEDETADAEAPEAAAASPRKRRARNKTRLLGFEPSTSSSVEQPAEDEPEDDSSLPAKEVLMFPVGWILVKEGPGRGACFPLTTGVSQIGRGRDQAVALDFGDMSVSRANHAAIAFDADKNSFHLGHGGKSNLVRLNGKPLLSTEELKNGDEITIGDTVLHLCALCGPDFNWDTDSSEGEEHVAIA